ncbi:MAG: hypothetical protein ACK5Q5_04775 [Planctomycetaceae bacterium]
MTATPQAANDRKGLVCPDCGGRSLRVLYTRRVTGGRIRRRRVCRDCGQRLTTYETFAPSRGSTCGTSSTIF